MGERFERSDLAAAGEGAGVEWTAHGTGDLGADGRGENQGGEARGEMAEEPVGQAESGVGLWNAPPLLWGKRVERPGVSAGKSFGARVGVRSADDAPSGWRGWLRSSAWVAPAVAAAARWWPGGGGSVAGPTGETGSPLKKR